MTEQITALEALAILRDKLEHSPLKPKITMSESRPAIRLQVSLTVIRDLDYLGHTPEDMIGIASAQEAIILATLQRLIDSIKEKMP